MDSLILDILAKNVRQFRETKGLSQEDLAYICGLHRTYIGGIERSERNITLKTLVKIAEGLTVNPMALLDGKVHAKNA